LLGTWPTPLELDSLGEDAEDFFAPFFDEDFVEVGWVVEVGAGVWLGTVLLAPVPGLVPGLDTLITWAGAVATLASEVLERPINTPTPIESSSTPTPAITAVGLLARGGSAVWGSGGVSAATGSAAAGCLGARRAPRSFASAPPKRWLRVPHSRQ
jgi:hypothetical protein